MAGIAISFWKGRFCGDSSIRPSGRPQTIQVDCTVQSFAINGNYRSLQILFFRNFAVNDSSSLCPQTWSKLQQYLKRCCAIVLDQSFPIFCQVLTGPASSGILQPRENEEYPTGIRVSDL